MLRQSKLTNVIIMCLVQFGSSRNKSVQLLIWARNIFGWTVQTLVISTDH